MASRINRGQETTLVIVSWQTSSLTHCLMVFLHSHCSSSNTLKLQCSPSSIKIFFRLAGKVLPHKSHPLLIANPSPTPTKLGEQKSKGLITRVLRVAFGSMPFGKFSFLIKDIIFPRSRPTALFHCVPFVAKPNWFEIDFECYKSMTMALLHPNASVVQMRPKLCANRFQGVSPDQKEEQPR